MTDLVLLTDAEITAVAGGAVSQSVSVAVTSQSTSRTSTSVTATNAGGVTATDVRSLIRVGVGNIDLADITKVRQCLFGSNNFAALKAARFGWF